jgi:hypothetical protein
MNASIACPKCRMALNPADFPPGAFHGCANCNTSLQMEEFPALRRPLNTGQAAETIVVDGEAGCFYHPGKKAVVPCAQCGRFLCALCDIELGDRHLCPNCVESNRQEGASGTLESSRMLYDELALTLSVVSLPTCGLLAPVGLYLGIRYWKSPTSLVARRRWKMPLAMFLSVVQIALVLLFIVMMILEP